MIVILLCPYYVYGLLTYPTVWEKVDVQVVGRAGQGRAGTRKRVVESASNRSMWAFKILFTSLWKLYLNVC